MDLLIFIYVFVERGEGREKERERNINVWLPLTRPLLGTWPTTQACALTGNRTMILWFAAGAQSTEPHQPRLIFTSVILSCFFILSPMFTFHFPLGVILLQVEKCRKKF